MNQVQWLKSGNWWFVLNNASSSEYKPYCLISFFLTAEYVKILISAPKERLFIERSHEQDKTDSIGVLKD